MQAWRIIGDLVFYLNRIYKVYGTGYFLHFYTSPSHQSTQMLLRQIQIMMPYNQCVTILFFALKHIVHKHNFVPQPLRTMLIVIIAK